MTSRILPQQHSSDSDLVSGETFAGFRELVPEASRARMRDDVMTILGRCALAPGSNPVTGLVVGQVQSGKTMSYEGLICLARDNGFPLVIIISGIATQLQAQGIERITDDLGEAAERAWHFIENPRQGDGSSVSVLQSVIRDWSDPELAQSRRRTAVINVLKNHRHLSNLEEVIRGLNWPGWPVLIIDDEADQASLDTRARRRNGGPSTTYAVLLSIRQLFATRFSYIQYTATPQAPLLITIADSLSPSFVHVLEPGPGYVGGEILFAPNTAYVSAIPAGDLAAINDPSVIEPPPSLVAASRVFFLGLAYAFYADEHSECRSMLIHPSQETDPHRRFANWANRLRDKWLDIIENRDQDKHAFDDLVDEFELARTELLRTQAQLPTVREIVSLLKFALSKTHIMVMNAQGGRTPAVPWDDFDGFILVGGQALDRGFTVKGLTVTYMSRGVGVGNADSVQQRARFFGYKADYLGFIRVFLESGVLEAFTDYLEHERDIRARLKKVEDEGTPLSDWRRAFVLDTSLRPTRSTVQRLRSLQHELSNEWFWHPNQSIDARVVDEVRTNVENFLIGKVLEDVDGHPDRTPGQRHKVIRDQSVREVLAFLAGLPASDEVDSLKATGLLVQIGHALNNNPEELCDVFVMRPGEEAKRSFSATRGLAQLFQGASPATRRTRQGEVYPGDRAIHTDQRLSVQIHRVNVQRDGVVVARDVPYVAVWVPEELASGWLVQHRGT